MTKLITANVPESLDDDVRRFLQTLIDQLNSAISSNSSLSPVGKSGSIDIVYNTVIQQVQNSAAAIPNITERLEFIEQQMGGIDWQVAGGSIDWNTQVYGSRRPADYAAPNGDSYGFSAILNYNSNCNEVNSNFKPAGLLNADGSGNNDQIDFGETLTTILISGQPDPTIEFAWPSTPIDDTRTYSVTIRYKADVVLTNGFYLRVLERNTELGTNITHIGTSAGEGIEANDSSKALISNGPVSDTWVEASYTYTPTAGTKHASLVVSNWSASSVTNIEIDFCRIIRNPATWSGLLDDGAKPEDNATLGATIGVDLGGTFSNSATVDAYFASNVISAAHIISINAAQINAGTITAINLESSSIRTASSGKRIELNVGSTNEVRSYDSSGTMRASIGVNTFGSDTAVGYFLSGTSEYGIYARSYGGYPCIYAYNSGAHYGISASSTNSYGGHFNSVNEYSIGVINTYATSKGHMHFRSDINYRAPNAPTDAGALRRTSQGLQYDYDANDTLLVTPTYVKMLDQKASGTPGGTFTSGAWQTRTLNTSLYPTAVPWFISLTSNQFTLAPGTYYIDARCPHYSVRQNKAKLRNITAGTDTIIGHNDYSIVGSGGSAFITGTFTILVNTTFEIQHRCTYSRGTDGFGTAASYGVNEIFTVVELWKIQ